MPNCLPRGAALLRRTPLLLLLLFLLSPRPVRAQLDGVHGTIGPYAGWTHWDSGTNLKDKPVYGARLGVMFGKYLGLEGTYGWIPAETLYGPTIYSPRDKTNLFAVGAGLHHVGADVILVLPLGRIAPYALGGYQRLIYDSDQESAPEADDDISGPELALGLMSYVKPNLALRAEVRDVSHSFDQADALDDARQDNIFFTVGIQYGFGGHVESHDMD
ncbi:MAG TPA: outer membrane beta-barrel protein, partial [Candidatus Eisenbacteria bacterium]